MGVFRWLYNALAGPPRLSGGGADGVNALNEELAESAEDSAAFERATRLARLWSPRGGGRIGAPPFVGEPSIGGFEDARTADGNDPAEPS